MLEAADTCGVRRETIFERLDGATDNRQHVAARCAVTAVFVVVGDPTPVALFAFQDAVDIPPYVIVLIVDDVDSHFDAVARRGDRGIAERDACQCPAGDMPAAGGISAVIVRVAPLVLPKICINDSFSSGE
jgi:hypothetical protein